MKDDGWENEEFMHKKEVCYILPTSKTWYYDLDFFLMHGFSPEYLTSKKRRSLQIKESPYQFINDILFRCNLDGVLLRYLEKANSEKVLRNYMMSLQEDTLKEKPLLIRS